MGMGELIVTNSRMSRCAVTLLLLAVGLSVTYSLQIDEGDVEWHEQNSFLDEHYSGDERTVKAEQAAQRSVPRLTAAEAAEAHVSQRAPQKKVASANAGTGDDFGALSGTGTSKKCPQAYHMGAMLDVAEKVCEATKEVSACSKGTCTKWSELGGLVAALDDKTPEAVWKVCCYRAYKIGGYQTCSKPDKTCKSAMDRHLGQHVKSSLAAALRSLMALKTHADMQKQSAMMLPKLSNLLTRIQAARGQLWHVGSCKQVMANPTPVSKCGWGGTKYLGQEHSLARPDIYCETIEWQYNQMGAGDTFMKKCRGAKTRTPRQQAAWNKHQLHIIKKDGVKPISEFYEEYFGK